MNLKTGSTLNGGLMSHGGGGGGGAPSKGGRRQAPSKEWKMPDREFKHS